MKRLLQRSWPTWFVPPDMRSWTWCTRDSMRSALIASTNRSRFVRVLIADDEKAFTTVLADLVRSSGHEVVDVVHSGLDAIRSYRQHKPDVVLMDFAMARLNGLTACRNILS